MKNACPVCGVDDHARLLHVPVVPAHSCVPLRDTDAARRVATSSLDLVACRGCGFVWNRAFTPSAVDYTQDYEETQAHSPRFRRFLDTLAAELASRRERTDHVLEVGSGKGEFLVAACRATGASGLGVDPAWDPARRPADAPDRVAFQRATLDGASTWTGDVVACRHTLEHVADVAAFTRWLADAARRTPGSTVLLEVPAAERILAEGAFWDVYHEHVSYLTADVLARVVEAAGLQIDDLDLAYDDQYLVCWARPDGGDGPRRPTTEGADPSSAADEIATRFRETIATWGDWFRDVGTGHRVALWGAGSKAVSMLTTLGLGHEVVAATDVNPHKWGTVLALTAHPVVAPRDLPDLAIDVVVAMNPIYRDEIRAELDALGLDRTALVALTPEPPTGLP